MQGLCSTPYRRRAQKQEEEKGPGEAEDKEPTEAEGAEGLTEAAARFLLSKVTPQKPSRPDEGSQMKETKDRNDFDGNFQATK